MRYAAYDGCAVFHIGTEAECEDFIDQIGNGELTVVPLVAPPMNDAELQELASCLYDGGWRAEDAEDLREHLDSAYKESEIDTILKAPMDDHDFARLLACLSGIRPREDGCTEDLEEITSDWALWDANEGHPVPGCYSTLEDLLDASEDMIIADGQHSAWSAGYRFEVVRYNSHTRQYDYIGRTYAIGDSVIYIQD